MKTLLYIGLIAGIVSIQSVLLPYVSLWGVKPDLGFVAVCLIGLFGGELEGLLFGLVLGWAMSLFSAQDLLSAVIIKGGVGFIAGVAGRQVAYLTPLVLVVGLFVISCLVGLITPFVFRLSVQQDVWWALWAVVLPQAALDAIIGGSVYWLISSCFNLEQWVSEYRI
jgi:mannose/fructose/N-acetylgalactosamine-specific phosphotransferase system component IID